MSSSSLFTNDPPLPIPNFRSPRYRVSEIHPAVYCGPSPAEALRFRIDVEDDLKDELEDHISFFDRKVCKDAALAAAAAESELQSMMLALFHCNSLTEHESDFLFTAINKAFSRVGREFLTPEARERMRIEHKIELPEPDAED